MGQKPVVVVAHWARAPLVKETRELVSPDDREKHTFYSTTRTELVIDRVIKGSIAPGKHALLWGQDVQWRADGTGLTNNSSDRKPPQQGTIADQALWFLSRQQDVGHRGRHSYLCVNSDRSIQPLKFEPFFTILSRPNRADKIGALLNHRDPEIVLRALTFIAGNRFGWNSPYESFAEWRRPRPWFEHPPLTQCAPQVALLISHRDKSIRYAALACYGLLAGQTSAPLMRTLLTDGDPSIRYLAADILSDQTGSDSIGALRERLDDRDATVRALAISVLALHKDRESISQFRRAATGIPSIKYNPERFANRAIDALAAWRIPEVVPTLISFLQCDADVYELDDIPAIRARTAIKNITGARFPLDTALSQQAWTHVAASSDSNQGRAILMKLLPPDSKVLKAIVYRDGKRTVVKIQNVSKNGVWIARLPAYARVEWTHGTTDSGPFEVTDRSSFINIKPGSSLQFPLRMSGFGFEGSSIGRPQTVKLLYARNGHQFGINAWIGQIDTRVR